MRIRTVLICALSAAPMAAQSWMFTRVDASSPAPAERQDGTLAYDPATREVYLFGGDAVGPRNDLWAWSVDRRVWREVRTEGGPPPARWGHTLVFDSARRRLVLFGGQAFGFFNDAWIFDIAASRWSKVAAMGPNSRYGHSAVYDAQRNRMIVSHGFTDSGRFDDTWALDLTAETWRNLSPSGGPPIRRCLHHSVVDPAAEVMYLYGGCASGAGPCPLGDLWALDLRANRWTEITAGGAPPPRQHYGMAFDTVRRRVVLFGGSGRGRLNDTWEFDPAARVWTQLAPVGTPPTVERHQGEFVPGLGVLFFGGRTANGFGNGMLVLRDGPLPPLAQAGPSIAAGGGTGVFSGRAAPLAPGKIVSLFGQGLGPESGVVTAFGADGTLPVEAGEVQVTVGGEAAPLYFVRRDQINVQVPYSVAGDSVEVAVRYRGQAGTAVTMPLAATSPDLFPSALHPDGRLVTAEAPARPGSVLIFFATGQGATSPASRTGARADGVFPEPVAPVRLLIGGVPAVIAFQGQAPGTAGVIQINATVPDGVAAGAAAVMLEIGGVSSQPDVTIPVARE